MAQERDFETVSRIPESVSAPLLSDPWYLRLLDKGRKYKPIIRNVGRIFQQLPKNYNIPSFPDLNALYDVLDLHDAWEAEVGCVCDGWDEILEEERKRFPEMRNRPSPIFVPPRYTPEGYIGHWAKEKRGEFKGVESDASLQPGCYEKQYLWALYMAWSMGVGDKELFITTMESLLPPKWKVNWTEVKNGLCLHGYPTAIDYEVQASIADEERFLVKFGDGDEVYEKEIVVSKPAGLWFTKKKRMIVSRPVDNKVVYEYTGGFDFDQLRELIIEAIQKPIIKSIHHMKPREPSSAYTGLGMSMAGCGHGYGCGYGCGH